MPIEQPIPAEIAADMIETFVNLAIAGLIQHPERQYQTIISNVNFLDFFVLYKVTQGDKTLLMPGELDFNECMVFKFTPFAGCNVIIESEPCVTYRPKRLKNPFEAN